MADLIVYKIIALMGLKGEAAEAKFNELSKLSKEELTLLLSNIEVEKTGFNFIDPKYDGDGIESNIWGDIFGDEVGDNVSFSTQNTSTSAQDSPSKTTPPQGTSSGVNPFESYDYELMPRPNEMHVVLRTDNIQKPPVVTPNPTKLDLEYVSPDDYETNFSKGVSDKKTLAEDSIKKQKTQNPPAKVDSPEPITRDEAVELTLDDLAQDIHATTELYYSTTDNMGCVEKWYDALKNWKNENPTTLADWSNPGVALIKNLIDGDLGTDNVSRLVLEQQQGLALMQLASEEQLTEREYYEYKDLLFVFNTFKALDKEVPSGVPRAILSKSLQDTLYDIHFEEDGKTRRPLEDVMRDISEFETLPKIDFDDEELEKNNRFMQKLKQNLSEALSDAKQETDYQEYMKTPAGKYNEIHGASGLLQPPVRQPKDLGSLQNGTDRLLSFEEVFKMERGCEFNPENVESYQIAKIELNLATSAFNKVNKFEQGAKNILYAEEIFKEKNHGNLEATFKPDQKNNAAMRLFTDYYGSAASAAGAVNRNIEELGYKDSVQAQISQKGEVKLVFNTNMSEKEHQGEFLKELLSLETAKHDISLDDFLNINNIKTTDDYAEIMKEIINYNKDKLGIDNYAEVTDDRQKAMDYYQKKYERTYKAAFGDSHVKEMVESMHNDNVAVVDNVSSVLMGAEMVGMAVGGVMVFTGIGTTPGTALSSVSGKALLGTMLVKDGLKFANVYSRNETNQEEINDVWKETAMDIGFLGVGTGAGKVGTGVQNNALKALERSLLKEGSKAAEYLAIGAGRTADVGCFVLANTAMTGDLHVSLNDAAIFTAGLGHARGNLRNNAFKEHAKKQLGYEGERSKTFDKEWKTKEGQPKLQQEYMEKYMSGEIDIKDIPATLRTTIRNLEKEYKSKHSNIQESATERDNSAEHEPIAPKPADAAQNKPETTEVRPAAVEIVKPDVEGFKLPELPDVIANSPDSPGVADVKLSITDKISEFFIGSKQPLGKLEEKRLQYVFDNNAKPHVQEQIGKAFDAVIEHIEESGAVKDKIPQPLEYYRQYELPDGTRVSFNAIKYGANSEMKNCPEYVVSIVTSDGKHTFLSANSEANIAKVKKIRELVTCMEIRENAALSETIKPASYDNRYVVMGKDGKRILTPEAESYVKEIATDMNAKLAHREPDIIKLVAGLKLGKLGTEDANLGSRTKSVQSLQDKITSAMLDKKNPLSLEEAVAKVYDGVGTRTKLADFDYTKDIDIVKELETGSKEAFKMAAKEQSDVYFKKIEQLVIDTIEGKGDVEVVKISNYKGEDGIPYLSKEHIGYLEVLIENSNKRGKIAIEDSERPSGYTALQMNLRVKDGTGDGFIFEHQFRGQKVNVFAEAEHVPYDIRQEKDVTGGNPNLKELYEPIKNAVEKLSDSEFKEYNKYLTKHYNHLRKLELGFESTAPELNSKFDQILNAENLQHLHDIADKVKKGKLAKEAALIEYKNGPTKVNKATEVDLREIHKIDLEAFAATDPVSTNFNRYKADLEADGLTSYVVKNQEGKVTGYFQIEPVKDGELYINSIGVPKELRNTRASYDALKQIQEHVTQIAKEQNIEKVALHVDAKNETLVKLYKKYGFEIKETERGYFENSNDAYYMELDVKKVLEQKVKTESQLIIEAKPVAETQTLVPQREILLSDTEYKELRKDFAKELAECGILEHFIEDILFYTRKSNIEFMREFSRELIANDRILQHQIPSILECTSKENIEFARELVVNDNIPPDQISWILQDTNKNYFEFDSSFTVEEKIEFARELVKNETLDKHLIRGILSSTTSKDLMELTRGLVANDKFPRGQIINILRWPNTELSKKMFVDKEISEDGIENFFQHFYGLNRYENIDSTVLYNMVKRNTFPNEGILRHSNAGLKDALSLAKLSDSQYKEFVDFFDYILDHRAKLNTGEIEPKELAVKTMLLSEHGIMAYKVLGAETIKHHSMEAKWLGFDEVISMGLDLNSIKSEDALALLKMNLEQLSDPQQKIAKARVITGICDNVSEAQLKDIINLIRSPEMSGTQIRLAEDIFSNGKSYEQQVEQFIKEFNVPENKQPQIREFLNKQQINKKLVTPSSIEEQIAVIDKRIQSINSNDRIPQDIKQKQLGQYEAQKQEMINNPEKFTKTRINDNTLKLLTEQVRHINNDNYTKEFNNKVYDIMYERLGVQATPELLSNIRFDDKYFATLFKGISDSEFKGGFEKLITLIKDNPGKKLSEIREQLSENQQTRQLFKENGLDYENWIKFDENSKLEFTSKVSFQNVVNSVGKNLRTELNDFLSSFRPTENAEHYNSFVNKLNELTNTDAYTEITHSRKELEKVLKFIESEIETNPVFKTDDPKIIQFKDHMKIHKKNASDLSNLKDTTMELFIRLSDNDNVGRNIFLGNHVGCCTTVGASNGFAAPQHLMNSYIRAIEIVDKGGNSFGNSMCYFAKVDGKVTFVIDSFEANGKLGAAPEVTNAIIDYAKQVCKEMGQPDANIMFGPNYNKINFNRCELTNNHTVEVIGRAPNETYVDAIGGNKDINVSHTDRKMYIIKDL